MATDALSVFEHPGVSVEKFSVGRGHHRTVVTIQYADYNEFTISWGSAAGLWGKSSLRMNRYAVGFEQWHVGIQS